MPEEQVLVVVRFESGTTRRRTLVLFAPDECCQRRTTMMERYASWRRAELGWAQVIAVERENSTNAHSLSIWSEV